jgi:hypothetical protein
LENERITRQQAERERDSAIAERLGAEKRLLEVMAAQVALEPSAGPERSKLSRKGARSALAGDAIVREPEVPPTIGDGLCFPTRCYRLGNAVQREVPPNETERRFLDHLTVRSN